MSRNRRDTLILLRINTLRTLLINVLIQCVVVYRFWDGQVLSSDLNEFILLLHEYTRCPNSNKDGAFEDFLCGIYGVTIFVSNGLQEENFQVTHVNYS